MRAPHLHRLLRLERQVTAPDGAGGHLQSWQLQAMVWAGLRRQAGRLARGAEQQAALMPVQVTLRAPDLAAPWYPATGWRFCDTAEALRIQTVTQSPDHPAYLLCLCHAEALP